MIFAGKTVVVTGAGSGIGRAVALGFCADGANVMGVGRTREDLEETARLCDAGRMQFVVGDIGRHEVVERLFSEAFRLHGKVDILVNNAALYPKVSFLESTHEEWGHVIQTNIIGMAHCCRLALPGMLMRGYGRIVNVGTFAWTRPIPKSSAYSASKAAVRPFTKALVSEIDSNRYPDVLINELIPGIAKTRMSESGIDPAEVYPHVSFVANLPRSGPTGKTFLQSTLYFENNGVRARLRRLIGRLFRGPVRVE